MKPNFSPRSVLPRVVLLTVPALLITFANDPTPEQIGARVDGGFSVQG